MIIGALDASPGSAFHSGQSYVVFGSKSAPAKINLANLNSDTGITINGGIVGSASGQAVSGGGDVNDDGHDDVLIGAPDTFQSSWIARRALKQASCFKEVMSAHFKCQQALNAKMSGR